MDVSAKTYLNLFWLLIQSVLVAYGIRLIFIWRVSDIGPLSLNGCIQQMPN